MLTVGQLARRFGLSRATLLYYEREGLLQPARQDANGYRRYDDAQIERLRRIVGYRSFGIPVGEIRELLGRDGDTAVEQALRRRFEQLEEEIASLRRQQEALVRMLEHGDFEPQRPMSKERWSAIMRAAGLDDEDMRAWHAHFEAREPEGHRRFLRSLDLGPDEVERIRAWSRAAGASTPPRR